MNNTINESKGHTPHVLLFGFNEDRFVNLGEEQIATEHRRQLSENSKSKMGARGKKIKKQFDKKKGNNVQSTSYNLCT